MAHYYIFKTDKIWGKTSLICGGVHDSVEDCERHWFAYMYGFIDGMFELLGYKGCEIMSGTRKLSFTFHVEGKKSLEYFMLLDKEGYNLTNEISKNA